MSLKVYTSPKILYPPKQISSDAPGVFVADIVSVPPVMLSKSSQIEGVVGRPVSVSCEASGMPAPKYEFHKVRLREATSLDLL